MTHKTTANDSTFTVRPLQIPYPAKLIDAIQTVPKCTSHANVAIILTHGAGGDMNLKQLVDLSENIANLGFCCIRFTCKGLNIKYRTNVYKEIINYVQRELGYTQIFVGGRSMGSRAAVLAVNEISEITLGTFIAGVICLSYPLHPPGDTSKLRDQPLIELEKPVLLLSGTADELCTKDLMLRTLTSVKSHEMVWIESADHSLNFGSEQDLNKTLPDTIVTWCSNFIQNSTDLAQRQVKSPNLGSKKRKRPKPSTDTKTKKKRQ